MMSAVAPRIPPLPAEVLAAYRYQPNLERRNHMLKGPQEVAPVYLKTPVNAGRKLERAPVENGSTWASWLAGVATASGVLCGLSGAAGAGLGVAVSGSRSLWHPTTTLNMTVSQGRRNGSTPWSPT